MSDGMPEIMFCAVCGHVRGDDMHGPEDVTHPAAFCGLCGAYLRAADAGHCDRCGALTRYELTPQAADWIAERDRRSADFDTRWQAMTPDERRRARLAAQAEADKHARRAL